MRIGINFVPPHETPEQWGDILLEKGYRATVFPVDYKAPVNVIDGYVKAAADRDIRIAEVGVWNSPNHPDPECAARAAQRCLEQFRLAEYVKADCCVNVSGAAGEEWYYCYKENYSEELYLRNVEFVQELCDQVKPEYTSYALEPMQWMLPWSAKQYSQFLKDVDRNHCKVHMDICNWVKDSYSYTHQEELIGEAFGILGKDIVSCHIKDIRLKLGSCVILEEVPIGTGELRLNSYLKQINKLNPDMPVLIEHLKEMEEYDHAFKWLKERMQQSSIMNN